MKIVINSRFGGFGLSHKAVMRYAELKGIKLYAWVDALVKSVYGKDIPISEATFVHYTLVPEEEYEAILEQEREKPIEVGRFEKSNELYFSDKDIPRDDPDLIQVIRELGKQADSKCSKLKIVNIPKDVEYEIEEYDGNEWISEKHRRWE